jgi:hypothetical protein
MRLAWTIALALSAAPALAADPDETPSVFRYGFRGLGTGALVGLGAGYLVARDEAGGDAAGDALRTVAIGAVTGGAVGLGLGLVDVGSDRPGVAGYALRDALYGAAFGLVTGALIGGVVNDPSLDKGLFGASVGVISGASLGLIIGVFEGRRAGETAVSVGPVGQGGWGPVLGGSF